MPIDDIRLSSENEEPPDCWTQVLEQWLMGKNATEITASITIADEWNNPMKISTLIDDLCEFRLPWGLNAISMFWKTSEALSESLDEIPFVQPQVVTYFASMLRFGVHHPVATVALALGLDNRQAALQLSQLYSGSIDATSILIWLQSLDRSDIEMSTDDWVQRSSLNELMNSVRLKRPFLLPSFRSPKIETLEVEGYLQDTYVIEGMELLSEVENNAVHFYTPDGDYLGPIISQDTDLLRDLVTGTVSATIVSVDWGEGDNNMHLLLEIR